MPRKTSYLHDLRIELGVTPEAIVEAIAELYGREFTTRRYMHYEGQDDRQVRRKRLGTLMAEEVAVAIRWAAGQRDVPRPAQPPPAEPEQLAPAVEAIVLDAAERDTFLRAWNDHELTLADVREMFDLRESEWRATLRFIGLREDDRDHERVALPPAAPAPAAAPATAPTAPDTGRYANPPGSNMTYQKASATRRRLVQDRITAMGITREDFLIVYDTRTIDEIVEHYGLSHGDVYVALGILGIPLRAGVKPAVEDPPPWPDEARRAEARQARQAQRAAVAEPVAEPAAGDAELDAMLTRLRGRRDALRQRAGDARKEREGLLARAEALRDDVAAAERELEPVVAAIASLEALRAGGED